MGGGIPQESLADCPISFSVLQKRTLLFPLFNWFRVFNLPFLRVFDASFSSKKSRRFYSLKKQLKVAAFS